MAEVRWRSYFLSVGVILPLTAVLSAAWMEVDPVSWKQWKAHSSGGTVNPYDNKEDPSKPRFASPLHKPSASLWWLDSTQLAVWRRQSIQRKDSADLLCWVNRLHPCYKENRQLTHTPSTTQENSQASLNGWKKNKQFLWGINFQREYQVIPFLPYSNNSDFCLKQGLGTPFHSSYDRLP